jgi:N-acetyltransferase
MKFEFQPTLKGNLVTLRPLRAGDLESQYAVASDPLIWEQHPIRDRYRREVFEKFFNENLAAGGALLVTDTKTDRVIGGSRFHRHEGATDEIEIGWTFLAREFWGGEYNGEMKRLMLDHAFRFVSSVIFLIGPENRRSRRAVEKLGGKFVGEGFWPGGLPKVTYRLLRDDWNARRV